MPTGSEGSAAAGAGACLGAGAGVFSGDGPFGTGPGFPPCPLRNRGAYWRVADLRGPPLPTWRTSATSWKTGAFRCTEERTGAAAGAGAAGAGAAARGAAGMTTRVCATCWRGSGAATGAAGRTDGEAGLATGRCEDPPGRTTGATAGAAGATPEDRGAAGTTLEVGARAAPPVTGA